MEERKRNAKNGMELSRVECIDLVSSIALVCLVRRHHHTPTPVLLRMMALAKIGRYKSEASSAERKQIAESS